MKDKAIQINNLSVCYGQNTALSNICLDVEKGEYLGIIGPNGGGKSTLLKAILGLVKPSSGSICIYGKAPDKRSVSIGYVPQIASMEKQFPITLGEVVLTGRLSKSIKPFFRFGRADKEIAKEILDKLGLYSLKDRRISSLSGGEFQKMLIARALVSKPEILLLDEPTASVDAGSGENIFHLLEDLSKKITVILVTHDLFAVSSHVHTLACLNVQMVYHGNPKLTDNIVHNLYGCPVDIIAHGVPHRVLHKHK